MTICQMWAVPATFVLEGVIITEPPPQWVLPAEAYTPRPARVLAFYHKRQTIADKLMGTLCVPLNPQPLPPGPREQQ
ncbi:MAG: hypothetical protein JF631_03400 [Mycobacterium sp.]|jgi:hypothetical protein|nr:hypothetical protein [Mycobacterium sp.]